MYLIDADAFLCMRQVSLLSLIAVTGETLLMTEFIARHELSSLAGELSHLESASRIEVHSVKGRTPEHAHFRRLRGDGADKGEAEAIAWAVAHRPDVVFITHDRGARKHAMANGLAVDDVLGLAVRLVAAARLESAAAQERFARWDDEHNAFGRPSDFTTLAETWTRRTAALT